MFSAQIILYTSKTLSNGNHPIGIRIYTSGLSPKYVFFKGKSCKKNQWDNKRNRPSKKYINYREVTAFLNQKESEATKLILDLENDNQKVSIEQLVEWYKKPRNGILVHDHLSKIEERLRKQNRIKYANSFKDLRLAMNKYLGKRSLRFTDINVTLLKRWEEDYMMLNDSCGGLKVYLSTLRRVYNDAINEGIVKQEYYPFRKYNINKLKNSNFYRALNLPELRKVINLKLESGTDLHFAQQLYLFSFYTNGMNFKDIAYLTWEKIENGKVLYNRKKTKVALQPKLEDDSRQIIEYFKANYPNDSDYIFPIFFQRHKTEQSRENRIHKVARKINVGLRAIASRLDIPPFRFYTARHTWASLMLDLGYSISYIQSGFGHQLESTSIIYAGKLKSDKVDNANLNLLKTIKDGNS